MGACGVVWYVCVCVGTCGGFRAEKVSLATLYYPDTLVNPDTCLGDIFMKYIFQYFNTFFGSKNYNFIDIENDPFRRKSFKRLMVHFRLKRSGNAEITITCEFSKVKTKRWENQKLFPKRLKNSPKRKVKNRI